MNTKSLISFLMDVSDSSERIKLEMRAIRQSCRILSEEEHEAIKELLLGAISDLEIADSDLHEYQRLGFISDKFAVIK